MKNIAVMTFALLAMALATASFSVAGSKTADTGHHKSSVGGPPLLKFAQGQPPYCCLGLYRRSAGGPLYCAIACDSPGKSCRNKIASASLRYSLHKYASGAVILMTAGEIGCAPDTTIEIP